MLLNLQCNVEVGSIGDVNLPLERRLKQIHCTRTFIQMVLVYTVHCKTQRNMYMLIQMYMLDIRNRHGISEVYLC